MAETFELYFSLTKTFERWFTYIPGNHNEHVVENIHKCFSWALLFVWLQKLF